MSDVRSYHDQDYYELLEVPPEASAKEIEQAYLRLKDVFAASSSATYMLFGDDESSVMRDMLEQAYATLSDANTRLSYDDRMGFKRRLLDSQPVLPPSSVSSTRSAIAVRQATATSIETPAIRPPATSSRAAVATSAAETPRAAAPVEPPPAPAVTPPAPRIAEPLSMLTGQVAGDAASESLEFSGGVLARIRENRGITLEAIAQRTKISLTHLKALESNTYDKLPARVYVRGFVTQYAKFLGLAPDRVSDSYLQIYDRFFQNR